MHRFPRIRQAVREHIPVAGYDRLATVFVKEHWEETDFAPHFTIADFFAFVWDPLIENLQFPKSLSQSIMTVQKYPSTLLLGTFLDFENQNLSKFSKIFLGAYSTLIL